MGRLAAVEEQVRGVREDVAELRDESRRSRDRLHSLESTAASLVQVQHERLRHEDRRDRKRDRQLQRIAVLVAFVAVVEPILRGAPFP